MLVGPTDDNIFGASRKDEDSDWLSVSDLMAGLMVIFLFIAIIFIRPLTEQKIILEQQQERITEDRLDMAGDRDKHIRSIVFRIPR